MILTVTLNPSLDLTLFLSKLRIGRVHRSDKEILIPGGKGINISRTLKIFNEDTYVLGISGGKTGEILEEELRKREIPFDFVKMKKDIRFAVGIIETENKRPTTVINGRGPEISMEDIYELKEKFKKLIINSKFVVLSGSIPPGVPSDIYSELLDISGNYPVIKVLDAQGDALKISLEKKPDIIKPNREEAEEILDFSIKTKRDLKRAGYFFKDKGIKYSLITLGEKGAFLATEEDMFFATLPPIKGFNWGAGDAFLAGFIIGIKNNDPVYALKLAYSTAYIKIQKLELKKEDISLIFNLLNKVEIQKII
ncbi:MAG: 1-phosphofructokinase family hexose kinase [Dictyoglomus sp.]|nr:1-phosphofructokinase family hexose kinase [Dictyoglomus sp.]MCX7942491.1 1-phosphofructokinase family hexose kinase [Dictyoglomaceae bacterium]MDW8187719.1 1-phosphofructokinase family hexose kinase [Dictyoglomus sp.]